MVRIFPLSHPEAVSGSAHLIFAREGAAMCRSFEAQGHSTHWNSISFHADAIKHLLEQPGVEGITFRHGMNKDEQTLVGFAVDAEGQVIGSVAIENGQRCPPVC